ncbi:hypothetical protein HQ544_00945 [Candidatus Falkowbacteria bacterium]|nr:hypothetical protein [Candidatus Falkowbacteria bacterium]
MSYAKAGVLFVIVVVVLVFLARVLHDYEFYYLAIVAAVLAAAGLAGERYCIGGRAVLDSSRVVLPLKMRQGRRDR